MFGKRFFSVVSVLTLTWLAFADAVARADFSFSVGAGSSGSNLPVAPVATVQFSQVNGNTMRVEINAVNNGPQFHLFQTMAFNFAAGVTLANPSGLNWTVGNGSPGNPSFITGNNRPRDGFNNFSRFNAWVYSGFGGTSGFSRMSFDLTGIDVIGDGSNFLGGNGAGLFLAMHISSFGDLEYSQWLGHSIGTNGSIAQPTSAPAPPVTVLFASGAVTGLGKFFFRRRKAA